MRHAMWMGTRGFEMFVPTPKISPGYNRVGYNAATPMLSGGVTMRSSKGAHQEYTFEWNNGSWDDVQPIRDMADGLYDTVDGVNLIRFTDPVAAARNILPPHWATPALGSEDAPSLDRGRRPSAALQPVSAFRLPARAAVFAAVSSARSLYVPIPPGHRAHFGWIGSGSGVLFSAATATGRGAVQAPAALGDGGTYTNASIDRDSATIGVEVSIAANATPTIRAMTLQILPTGRTPRVNVPWASGQGNSGCQFGDRVGLVPLSVPLDLEAASTTLIETGDWL